MLLRGYARIAALPRPETLAVAHRRRRSSPAAR